MNKDSLYAIWLTQALGYGKKKVKQIYEFSGTFENFFGGGEKLWKSCKFLTSADVSKLVAASLDKAKEIFEYCAEKNYTLLPLTGEDYPKCLKEIYAPPALLYVKGSLPDFDDRLSISVVGTRKASNYGLRNAYIISYGLSKAGAIIVSGGAYGVDSASHDAALRAGGVTVCVLGCGIERRYLKQNEKMRELVTKNGALISEYPPKYPVYPYNFPVRNRIISALSNAVAVIEAGAQSGALITANAAAEQGKTVFALMGNVDSPLSAGTNALIKDGAVPITGFEDIIDNFSDRYKIEYPDIDFAIINNDLSSLSESEKDVVKEKKPANLKPHKAVENKENITLKKPKSADDLKKYDLSGDAVKIYKIFKDKPVHVDSMVLQTGMPVFRVLSAVTELEMADLITGIQGRQYMIK